MYKNENNKGRPSRYLMLNESESEYWNPLNSAVDKVYHVIHFDFSGRSILTEYLTVALKIFPNRNRPKWSTLLLAEL